MQNDNKDDLGLFDHASAGANDWQVFDGSQPEDSAPEEKEAPQANAAPQIWDDIPREEEPPAQVQAAPEEEKTLEEESFPEIQGEESAPFEVEETPVDEVQQTPQIEEEIEQAPFEEPLPASRAPQAMDQDAEPVGGPVYRYVAPAEIATLEDMGRYLSMMRRKANLSAAEVSEATKIRGDYLEAIESGDASELPQAVYVLAYIRKLCDLYSIDTVNLNNFFEDLRDGFSYELPEDINKSIVGHENDEEQQKKMRQLAIGLIAGGAVVALALIVGIVMLIVALAKGDSGKPCTVSDRKIVEYQGKEELRLHKLAPRI